MVPPLAVAVAAVCFALEGGRLAEREGEGDDLEELAPFVWMPGGTGRFAFVGMIGGGTAVTEMGAMVAAGGSETRPAFSPPEKPGSVLRGSERDGEGVGWDHLSRHRMRSPGRDSSYERPETDARVAERKTRLLGEYKRQNSRLRTCHQPAAVTLINMIQEEMWEMGKEATGMIRGDVWGWLVVDKRSEQG